MKKIQLFLLSCCMVVSVSASSPENIKKRKHRLEDGYSITESLIKGIEDGKNEIQEFVRLLGYDILDIVDSITHKPILVIACEAENWDAATSIEHLIYERRSEAQFIEEYLRAR